MRDLGQAGKELPEEFDVTGDGWKEAERRIDDACAARDLETLCNAIIPSKDFDGMGKDAIVLPAVDVGILSILEYVLLIKDENGNVDGFNPPYPAHLDSQLNRSKPVASRPFPGKGEFSKLEGIKEKEICIVNDSIILGKPLAKYLLSIGCHVNVCNKYTPDISVFTKEAYILISGTGVAGLITAEIVKPGVIAIDCGFPTGDCDESVFQKAKAITPVPGGVGPLTVTCLFENLLTLIKNK
jgi:methylenetetrahydrofolate dehydrogenase (NADP+)/methenyltetrahydrofolate cyclohydrolase